MFKHCIKGNGITKMKDSIPTFKPSFSKDTANSKYKIFGRNNGRL